MGHARGTGGGDALGDDAADRAGGGDALTPARTRGAMLGAMFLMATSAIGPGFVTQTATFTAQLGAAFAFAILASIVIDVAIQSNVWRVIGVSGLRAPQLADRVLPGAGRALALLVVLGGLVFNVGNVAGAGLGLEALLGLPPLAGGLVSAAIAIAVFAAPRAGLAMDRLVVALGFVMIALTGWVAWVSEPPLGRALVNAVWPERIDALAIVTLVGGTVGGYITYAGAHRLLDAGIRGPAQLPAIAAGALRGVLLTGLMRVLLFLAVLGVVAGGATLDPKNPAASAFGIAAGEFGLRAFGLILWAAALTSVIGASYTSVSFLAGLHPALAARRGALVVGFVVLAAGLYALVGAPPVALLIFAGAFNGLILPLGVGLLLWVAWRRADLLHGYAYPRAWIAFGALGWLATLWLATLSLAGLRRLFG